MPGFGSPKQRFINLKPFLQATGNFPIRVRRGCLYIVCPDVLKIFTGNEYVKTGKRPDKYFGVPK